MPAIVRKLQRRQISFEQLDTGDAGVISVHMYVDSKGKEYRVAPGMLAFDEFIINTDRIIGGFPSASRGGIKIQIDGIDAPMLLSATSYDIAAVQDLLLIAQNLKHRHD